MWSRFQIGSNMPFANRSAIRFCTASRPRKWSMRKTRSSGKTRVHERVELHGALQVHAERLLEHHPRALYPGPASPSALHRGAERAGRAPTGSAGGPGCRGPSRPRSTASTSGFGSSALNALKPGRTRTGPSPRRSAALPIAALRDLAEVLHRPALAGGADDPVVRRASARRGRGGRGRAAACGGRGRRARRTARSHGLRGWLRRQIGSSRAEYGGPGVERSPRPRDLIKRS